MLRSPWKARAPAVTERDGQDDEDDDENEGDEMDVEHEDERDNAGYHPTLADTSPEDEATSISQQHTTGHNETGDTSMNGLTESLQTLSLVPPSIRFGRGGKNGGFKQHQNGNGSGGPAAAGPSANAATRGGRGTVGATRRGRGFSAQSASTRGGIATQGSSGGGSAGAAMHHPQQALPRAALPHLLSYPYVGLGSRGRGGFIQMNGMVLGRGRGRGRGRIAPPSA
jgi:hypothetical protein